MAARREKLFQELFALGQHQLVARGIEVGVIVGCLEVGAAEVAVFNTDGAAAGVEHADSLFFTHATNGLDDGLETRLRHVPGRHEADGCMGIFRLQPTAE